MFLYLIKKNSMKNLIWLTSILMLPFTFATSTVLMSQNKYKAVKNGASSSNSYCCTFVTNKANSSEVSLPIIEKKPVERKTEIGKPMAEIAILEEQKNTKRVGENDEILEQLLQKYVSDEGKVNYKGLKLERKRLEEICQSLSSGEVAAGAPRNEQMAYWINVYNLFTIKLIVDNYPITSIQKLDNGKTWDVARIPIGEKKYSLNDIENKILRTKFKDARIHFALNCGAKSCPPLYNRAWKADNLEANLAQRTVKFINNQKFNKLAQTEIKIAKIFDWYQTDFGSIIDFLNKYSVTKINKNAKIVFLDYDWTLNE